MAIVILLFCALIAAGGAIGGVVGVEGVEDGIGLRDYLWVSPDLLANAQLCSLMLSYAQLKCALRMRNLSWT